MRVIFKNGKLSVFIALREKLPPFQEISSFFATIVFVVYGWTSVAFFWKVPSWMYFLSASEIVVIFAYLLVSSLLESAVILIVFLVAGLALPADWLRNKFVVRSSIIFFSLALWVALFDMGSPAPIPTDRDMLSFFVGFPLTAGLGILSSIRLPSVDRFMTFVGDQLIVFLYLWIPLSLMGLLIVLLRNI